MKREPDFTAPDWTWADTLVFVAALVFIFAVIGVALWIVS